MPPDAAAAKLTGLEGWGAAAGGAAAAGLAVAGAAGAAAAGAGWVPFCWSSAGPMDPNLIDP